MAHYLDRPNGGFVNAPASECSDCPEVEGRLHGYNCFTPNYEVIGAKSCANVLQSIPAEVKKRVKRKKPSRRGGR